MNNKIPAAQVRHVPAPAPAPAPKVTIHSNIAYSELLVLYGYGLAAILQPFMTKISEETKRALQALDYFEFLDDDQIIEACRIGTLKQYNPLDTIHFDDKVAVPNVHFVLSGECLILQCLNVEVNLKKGKKTFQLSNDEDDSTNKFKCAFRPTMSDQKVRKKETNSIDSGLQIPQPEVSSSSSVNENKKQTKSKRMTPGYESHFIDVGTLSFGAIIGLADTIRDRVVLARTTVQCLVLPRSFLLEKNQNPGNIWGRRVFYLNSIIPSRDELFTHFLQSRNWKKFKTDFIRKSVRPSPRSHAYIDDVPIICKIVESPKDVH